MRKISIIVILTLIGAAFASAQDMYDALRFSQNTYQGTARSISMGNAFTALGGDLGSLGINPAGSAVNPYSQATITPSISISGVEATYDPAPGMQGDNTPYTLNTSRTRLLLPNIGFVVNWKNDDNSSIKNFSFGLVGNTTANYNSHITGRGINAETSILGDISSYLSDQRINYNDITSNNAYNNYTWQETVAARAGMVSVFGNHNDQWIGATETEFPNGSIGTAGLLDQRWGRVTSGYKYDMVINFGMNVSNMFFLGANLGVVALEYNTDTYMREFAVDPNAFLINFDNGETCFDNMRLSSWKHTEGSGIYGKFGVIFVPVPGFRIGAAVQTPTVITLKESWQESGDITFTDNIHSASESSPEGNFEYELVTPMRFNVGAAITFGNGAISADYEYTDFTGMKFRDSNSYDNSAFDNVNYDIKDFTGPTHMFRAGFEYKPTPSFSLRAGYNYSTCSEYTYEGYTKKAIDAITHAVSAGLGFSSDGPFFCDLAVRNTFLPKQYISPYNTYITDPVVNSPEISYKHNLLDVVVTFGWRF